MRPPLMGLPTFFGMPCFCLDVMIMTTSRRVRVIFLLCSLCLLLPGLAHGQKFGRGFMRPPPSRPPTLSPGRLYSKGSGNLGGPPSNLNGLGTIGRPTPLRPNYPMGGGKFGTAVKILTSVAAAASLRNSAHALHDFQRERALLDDLRSRGQDRSDDCIYSAYFKVNGGKWSDLFSDPDLFFYVDIEGQGSFLVPQIHWNYVGGPILDRVLARDTRPGARVVVRVLDDDSWTDEVWNNILQTKLTIDLSPEVKINRFVSIRPWTVGGQIQLLDRNIVLDAPDPVATAEFVVPEAAGGFWAADATLYDGSGNDVGNVQFACVQSAKGEWQEHASAASGWLGSAIFWLVLGTCLLIWFVKQVFSKGPPEPAGSK